MKKVLLASTALCMTAGVAAAEVSLSGYAEIGIKQQADGYFTEGEMVFHNDIDVTFTLSGETDGGLTFGATIDLDEVMGSGTEIDADDNLSSVFVSGDFGTITMGDTDGAFDWAMTEIAWGTAIADDHSSHAGWNGNSGLDGQLDGQVARYEYAFGDFAVAISAEVGPNTSTTDEVLGIGVKYSTSLGGADVAFGLGYQDGPYAAPTVAVFRNATTVATITGSGTADIWGASLSADLAGGFSVRLNYSKLDGVLTTATTAFSTTGGLTGSASFATTAAIEWDHVGVGVGYQMGDLLVEANYGKYDGTLGGTTAFEADGYGLAVNYDLGGGAVVMVGYGNGTGFATSGVQGLEADTWSAGLGLSF